MAWKDKDRGRLYRIEWRKRNKEFIDNYLENNSCCICGFSDIRALDFDHIDRSNKVKEVKRLMNGTPSLERLKEEIDKCQVLCANCHRIKTLEDKDYLSIQADNA